MLAVHVVGYVPFLGSLAEFVVLLFGLGGLTVAGYHHVRRRRADDADPTA